MLFQQGCHLAIKWRVFLPPMPKCTGGTSDGLCGVLQRLAGTQLGHHGLLDPTNSCFTSDLKLFTEGGVGVLPLPECPFTDTMPSCCFRTVIPLPDIMENGGLQPSSAGTSLRYGCLLPYHLIRLTAQCAISPVGILCPNAGIERRGYRVRSNGLLCGFGLFVIICETVVTTPGYMRGACADGPGQ